MKKLHMGTMSFGSDSMDEIAHQLALAFGTSGEAAHQRQGSLVTGAQLAVRGRRDMSSRVKDVVLSLALCHNVSGIFSTLVHLAKICTGYACNKRRRNGNISGLIPRRSRHCHLDCFRRPNTHLPRPDTHLTVHAQRCYIDLRYPRYLPFHFGKQAYGHRCAGYADW